MNIVDSIRKRATLLEFLVWLIALLVLLVIAVAVGGIQAGEGPDSVEDPTGLVLMAVLSVAAIMALLPLVWRKDRSTRVLLLISSFGVLLLPLLLGDIVRLLVVKRLYTGEKPLGSAVLPTARSARVCTHCNGEGVCTQGTGFPGEQSCESCLVAAGVTPTLKRVVKCGECKGTGKQIQA